MRALGWFIATQCLFCGFALDEFAISPHNISNGNLFKYGFRVNLKYIPMIDREIPTNVSWSEFVNVSKIATSAAYNIYSALWKGETVVLKSLREKGMRSGSPTEMEKEILILSRIEHPNIIKLLGSGYEPFRFQILEHLGGGTLHKILKDRLIYPKDSDHSVAKLLPQEMMFEYGIKLAEALHYMHENFHPAIRIFHRDLKMQNVGLTKDGVLKVFDFGMAELIRKTVDENVLFKLGVASKRSKALGTWPYTSPEVVRREKYNHKSDIYCYAIVFHYIMVGKHPMRHIGNHLELKEDVTIHDGWRPDPDPRWPDELTQLFAQMWNNDIIVRPNMKEVADRLREINKMYPHIFARLPPKLKRGEIEFE